MKLFLLSLLVQLSYSSEFTDKKECQICKEDLKDEFRTSYAPCFHKFHNKCLHKWIKQSKTCPECRIDLSTCVDDVVQKHKEIKRERKRLKKLNEQLMCAAQDGDSAKFEECYEYYREKGAELPVMDYGHTFLHFAALGGSEYIVEFLLEQNLNVNAQTQDTLSTALMFAAQHGKGSFNNIVKILLEAGANSNLENYEGQTAFDLACTSRCYNTPCCYFLSQKGLNDLFMNAIKRDAQKNVKNLVAAGADVNCKDGYGNTALHFVVGCKYKCFCSFNSKMMEVLLSLGANVDELNDDGSTPLHHAVQDGPSGGCASKVVALLKAGANINARDSIGNTALILAGWNSHADVMKILLDAKADKQRKNKFGKNALDLARSEECHALLKCSDICFSTTKIQFFKYSR